MPQYTLNSPAPPFLAVGHTRRLPELPDLAPPCFSPADQLAEPTLPRTRVVKDVLRVGRWKTGATMAGPTFWEVKPQTLRTLADQYRLAQSRGISHNLVKGHGDPHSGAVHADDLVSPLDQVFVANDTLWVSAYVTPAEARTLCNPAQKVSVRVMEHWLDGAGRSYPLMLLHVALVDEPVVDSQGPFRQLGLSATAKPASSHPFSIGDLAMPIDLPRLRAVVNTLLAYWDLSLPESTTEATFADDLDALVQQVVAQETDTPADEAADAQPEANDLSHTVAGLTQQLRDLAQTVAALRQTPPATSSPTEADASGRGAFDTRLNSLAMAGNIDAKTLTKLKRVGEAHGWDLALLEPFQDVRMIDMSRVAQSLATNTPPTVPGALARKSPEELLAAVKALGG